MSAYAEQDIHLVLYENDKRLFILFQEWTESNIMQNNSLCLLGMEEKKLMHRDSGLILSWVFNQMCDDAEFALKTPVFCLLPILHTHTPLEPSVK